MSRNPKSGRFEPESGTYVDSKGYPTVTSGQLRGMRVHRLVALAKFGKAAVAKDAVIHHIDGNKLNCHPDNLELLTSREHNSLTAKQRWYVKEVLEPAEKEAWDEWHGEVDPEPETDVGGGQRCRLLLPVAKNFGQNEGLNHVLR